jgi:hypothetical protein
MNKKLYLYLLVASAVSSYFLPWCVIAPVCFGLSAYFAGSGKEAFVTASAAITTLWLGYASFLNVTATVSMAEQVGNLFAGFIPQLEKLPKTGLIFSLMTLIGANVGGLSALAGYHLRNAFR